MLLTISAILILSFIIYKWRFLHLDSIPFQIVLIVFVLKILAGFCSYTYHNYYFAGGDSAIYLNGGLDLLSFSNGNPINYIKLFLNLNRGVPEWEEVYRSIIYWDSKSALNSINDNRNAIRFNSLISLLSFKNTLLHIVLLNFISLIGLTALYKSARYFLPTLPASITFLAVFLSPSILFWTSGILKETHTILFLGLFFMALSKLIETRKIKYIFLLLLLSILLLLVRTYLALIVIGLSCIFYAFETLKVRNALYFFISIALCLVLGFFLLRSFQIDLFTVLKDKQIDFIYIGENANSFFKINELKQEIDIVRYFPIAIINVFLQPQLLTLKSWLFIFPLIENLDVLFFCFLAIRYHKKPSQEAILFLSLSILIYLISSWLIGLTVPVQGAIARYKALSQPFLLLFIFSFIDWGRIKESYFSVSKTA